VADEPGQNETPPEKSGEKAPTVQENPETQEQKLALKPSIWPICLAFALVITSIGVIVHPIMFICGIVLCIVVIFGWLLEQK
jgi:hypothetical protein